jgi:hypothetical protein
MARLVQKRKGPFGETIYFGENFHMIGTSSKGAFGEEIFLDKNYRFAGTKQKGILGEDIYLDKDLHMAGFRMKGIGDSKILTGMVVMSDFPGKELGIRRLSFWITPETSSRNKYMPGYL